MADPPATDRQVSVKELMAPNFVLHRNDLVEAAEDVRYLRQRRDGLSEKLKLGLVALNGASLVALLGALGGSGAGAAWIGITHQNALYSAAAFAVGLILAGHSLNVESRLYNGEAGDAYARAGALKRLAAQYERVATAETLKAYAATMDELARLPLVGFQWNWWSTLAQNLSGGAWLFGIALPLMGRFHPSWIPLWA